MCTWSLVGTMTTVARASQEQVSRLAPPTSHATPLPPQQVIIIVAHNKVQLISVIKMQVVETVKTLQLANGATQVNNVLIITSFHPY